MLFIFLLVGCATEPIEQPEATDISIYVEQIAELNAQINRLEQENISLTLQLASLEDVAEELSSTTTQTGSLIASAIEVVTHLSENDMEALSEWVHVSEGVRFSPYGYVNTTSDLVFNAQTIETLWLEPQIFNWGAFDGTGDPILFNFQDYYNRFIYDEDYLNPHMIGIDNVLSFGNTLINFDVVYPDASFVEFHFTGFDPQYMGMDWRSLFLIFEEVNNEWFLIGIVHNEWTI